MFLKNISRSNLNFKVISTLSIMVFSLVLSSCKRVSDYSGDSDVGATANPPPAPAPVVPPPVTPPPVVPPPVVVAPPPVAPPPVVVPPPTASIAGCVFVDADRGIDDSLFQSSVDNVVKDVTVNLVDSSGNVVATQTTGSQSDYTGRNTEDGCYLFSGLTVGDDYKVVVVPTGHPTIGSMAQYYDPEGNSSPDNSSNIITPVAGLNNDFDFGFNAVPTASIAGCVFVDADRGVDDSLYQSASDSAVANVSVNLLDSTGNVVATQTTGTHMAYNGRSAEVGCYLFDGLNVGSNYRVEVLPTGHPTLGSMTQYYDPEGNSSPDNSSNVITPVEGLNSHFDFGFNIAPLNDLSVALQLDQCPPMATVNCNTSEALSIVGGGVDLSTTCDASPKVIDLSSLTRDQAYALVFSQTNDAGTKTVTSNITVDSVAQPALTCNAPAGIIDGRIGSHTLTGTCDATKDPKVRVTHNGTIHEADCTGTSYSISIPLGNTNGVNSYSLSHGPDTACVDPKVVPCNVTAFIPGSIGTNTVSSDCSNQVEITQCIAGQTIDLSFNGGSSLDNSALACTSTVNAAAPVSVTNPIRIDVSSLGSGTHSFIAKQVDQGLMIDSAGSITINDAPTKPVLTVVSPLPSATCDNSASPLVAKVLLSGTCEANKALEISGAGVSGAPVALSCEANGSFNHEVSLANSNAANAIEVRYADPSVFPSCAQPDPVNVSSVASCEVKGRLNLAFGCSNWATCSTGNWVDNYTKTAYIKVGSTWSQIPILNTVSNMTATNQLEFDFSGVPNGTHSIEICSSKTFNTSSSCGSSWSWYSARNFKGRCSANTSKGRVGLMSNVSVNSGTITAPTSWQLLAGNRGHAKCATNASPLLVNFNDSELIKFSSNKDPEGMEFDIDGDGLKERISCPTNPGYAFLTLPIENDPNPIQSVHQLFGDLTIGPDGKAATTHGFDALAKHDLPSSGGNVDGVIDSHDQVYSKLRLWQESNCNGIAEPEELFTLESKNVAKIHYMPVIDMRLDDDVRVPASLSPVYPTDDFGNIHKFRSMAVPYKYSGNPDDLWLVFDVWFGYDNNAPNESE